MPKSIDKEKFIQILNENKLVLYKVINIYCKESEDRKDLEQEIIIQLWKSFESYNSQFKLSTWIYKIAMNVSISFYRNNFNRKTRTSPLGESIFQVAELQNDSFLVKEERKFLNEFISQLDEFNKEIIILYLENYSYKKIAEMVGISESNVGTKINRLKIKLKENYVKFNILSNGIR
jgi:RNA polymerase sigma-70 factor (ECF subfamily)